MCLDTDLYGKDSAKERHVKEKRHFFSFRCMSECSLSYEKIAQKSDMSKKKDFFLLRCMSEYSLSYEKIVQKSDMWNFHDKYLSIFSGRVRSLVAVRRLVEACIFHAAYFGH